MNAAPPAPPATTRARHAASALVEFAQSLLMRAGMPGKRARDVADILVEADLLGHDTHGLQLLASYLQHIESGQMKLEGEPITLADHGAVLTWDGQRLPGQWLVLRAMEIASEKAKVYGSGTVAIGRSHHIACLAAYLKRATDQGLVMLLLTSAPAGASVFLQILDPQAFGGGDAFRRQMDWVAQACLDNPPRKGHERVRLPGQLGLARREQQLRDGVELEASILPALTPWADKFRIALPAAL